MRIAIDAMGGDNAPQEVVSGAVLAAKAYDQAGNVGNASITVTVNNVASKSAIALSPSSFAFFGVSGSSTPPVQSMTIANTGTASLAWTGSTSQAWCHVSPASGVVNVGSNAIASISVDAPSNVGTFTCTVTVADPSASNSPQTATATYTVVSPPVQPPVTDATPPTTSITSPTNGSIVTKATKFTISVAASDNIGVAKVEIFVNAKLQCTDAIAPYTCVWNIPGAANKTYKLQSKAYDAAGNTGFSSVIMVTAK